MANFINSDRSQAFLLPPDLRDWLPEDDLAHFVIAAVERVDLSLFKINDRGSGKAQYHPRMMSWRFFLRLGVHHLIRTLDAG